MSSTIKNVIIIGAGGHLGPSLLSDFDADPNFNVSVLARQSSQSTFPPHIKVHRIGDGYPDAELVEVFKGQDAVISSIARASMERQKAIIDAAVKAGVKRFVPSDFGSDLHNEKAAALLPQYFAEKLGTGKYLKEKEKDGLTWTSFATGPFFEMSIQLGYLGFNLKEHKATFLGDGNTRYSMTKIASIGLAVKNAMLLPEKTANKDMYIDSFTASPKQILASLEKATGQKWDVEHLDAEKQKKTGLEKLSKGDMSGGPLMIQYMMTVAGHGGDYALYRETSNELLSLPKQTLDEAVAEVITYFYYVPLELDSKTIANPNRTTAAFLTYNADSSTIGRATQLIVVGQSGEARRVKMPPKKDQKGQKPAAQKVAVDKTFGMKNKKGATAQRQIAQMKQAQAQAKTPEQKKKEAEKEAREKEKKAAEQAQKEAAELFKPVQVQKVPFGVDPKTVVCQFWKKGTCEKGKKCKFAHDLAVERKSEKRDLYSDSRGKEEDENKKDEMADWDEEKLRQVVLSKHGNPKTTTDIVCKHFIEAVENQKYGWFWTCPNGGDQCKYRHSLPPGFVLKTKDQRAAEKALMDKSPLNTLTLEDFLESERHKLTGTLTPVNPETFAKWKKERMDKKAAEEAARKAKEDTGRAMFEKGGWQESDDEDDDDVDGAGWNLQQLRLETEQARARREEERLTGGWRTEDGVKGETVEINGDEAYDGREE